MKKTIVVSAVNIIDAGQLEILKGCLNFLDAGLADRYDVIALVNNKSGFPKNRIRYMEFPESKRSWFRRLYFEYFHFKQLSKDLAAYLWLSMQDITPNIRAERLATYCHHASPFYRLSVKELWLDPKFALFHFLYKYLYRKNIRKNNFVIVQQEWIRKEFKNNFGVLNVIVAHPEILFEKEDPGAGIQKSGSYSFFYPSFPRVFKNFETACEAAKLLAERGVEDFRLYLTINGSENRYSAGVVKKYRHVKQIEFTGILPRMEVFQYYRAADCFIFPSKLETWGVPISEMKLFKKPILVADVNYARETVGDFDKAKYFDPNDPACLSELMESAIKGDLKFDKNPPSVSQPYAKGWASLFSLLLEGKTAC